MAHPTAPALSILKYRRGWNTLCPTWANPCVRSLSRWRHGDWIIKNRRNKKHQACRSNSTGLMFSCFLYHSEYLSTPQKATYGNNSTRYFTPKVSIIRAWDYPKIAACTDSSCACCYEVTSCQEQKIKSQNIFSGVRAESQYNSFPALATLLYAGWIPQVNGPPWILPSIHANQSN